MLMKGFIFIDCRAYKWRFLMNRKIHAFYEAFLHRLIEVGLEQTGRISKPRLPVEFRETSKCQI
jgi:hypothetical protein